MAEEPNNSMSALASQICNQISSVFTAPTSKPPAMIVLVEEIAAAASRNGKVFVYGVGREGLMLKALSMRLFHLGLATHCIFDMTTPPNFLTGSPHRLRRSRWFLHRRCYLRGGQIQRCSCAVADCFGNSFFINFQSRGWVGWRRTLI
ncbi:Sugar isomerase (SIS) family protein [Abeliophyllum distichum]|uniref:Sugar isomerase (SIS) family protein n=1 Tax=Abeliophyllum distichum TaxID=126358 RepID=A0ABD1TZC9_9LAMI